MNGPHDMGGFTGFGPVKPEADEPVWHHDWEARAFALVLAMGMTGAWNIDQARHARERVPALTYWSANYHDKRFQAFVMQLLELGLITPEEEATARPSAPSIPLKRVPSAVTAPEILAKGGPSLRQNNIPPRFEKGSRIRTRVMTHQGHTRLPRYAMGRVGEIVALHGIHVFPDSNAHGKGEDPHWLYTVRFSAKELWGKDTADSVCLDLWEPYLEAIA